jgi:hypothetical protein
MKDGQLRLLNRRNCMSMATPVHSRYGTWNKACRVDISLGTGAGGEWQAANDLKARVFYTRPMLLSQLSLN